MAAEDIVPETFDEAVQVVIDELAPDDHTLINEMPIEICLATGQQTIGDCIRKDWGLWDGEGKLFHCLKDLGLTHPEDMSAVILTAVICKVHGKEFNLKSEVQKYKTNRENKPGLN